MSQTVYEKAFFPKSTALEESINRWLEQEVKNRKIHIHHSMCGHGGERWIEKFPVDGYNSKTTLYINTTATIGTAVQGVTMIKTD